MKKTILLVTTLFIGVLQTINGQTVVYSENFETTVGTNLPAGWSKTQAISNTTSGWQSGVALNSQYFPIPTHTRYMAVNDDGTQTTGTNNAVDNGNDMLISPSYNFTSAAFPVLTFDLYYGRVTYSSNTEIAQVRVSTNGGLTWAIIDVLSSTGGVWASHYVSLAAYVGMPNVMIGFYYSDVNMWMYGVAIDNFKIIEPGPVDVTANNIMLKKYVMSGSQTIKTVISDWGGPQLTSVTMNYNVDGGAVITQTFAPNIYYGATYGAQFTVPYSFNQGVHYVKSWVSDINGSGLDSNVVDDTAYFQITVLPDVAPPHNVLLEEYDAAWCGYSPRAGISITVLCSNNPTVIGASIHDNDAMSSPEGNIVDAIYPQHFGYPCGTIDRSYDSIAYDYAIFDGDWAAYAPIREAEVVPATISLSAVSYDSVTRIISATVNATFVGSVKGKYAVNCYITENRVYGPLSDQTVNGYNAASFYYTDASSPFYNMGITSSPWTVNQTGLIPIDYVHNYVVEKMIGGAYGDTTVVPTTLVPSFSTYSKTFTYTLPAANPGGAHRYNPENIHIIGMVQEYNSAHKVADQYILNVTTQKLTTANETGLTGAPNMPIAGVNVREETMFGAVSVYPNPASASANINIELTNTSDVSINIYNMLGQLVITENHTKLSAGNHLYSVDVSNWANGMYNVVIHTNNGWISKKLVVNK